MLVFYETDKMPLKKLLRQFLLLTAITLIGLLVGCGSQSVRGQGVSVPLTDVPVLANRLLEINRQLETTRQKEVDRQKETLIGGGTISLSSSAYSSQSHFLAAEIAALSNQAQMRQDRLDRLAELLSAEPSNVAKVVLSKVRFVQLSCPRIGMTIAQASKSCWGMPEDVYRTITAGSVSERWAFGSSNYLYFTNGRLTRIEERKRQP